jgi:hypothetical protein
MALTSEQITQIALDMLAHRKPSITGRDADDFRVAFQRDIDLAEKKGWKIELPFEVPDISNVLSKAAKQSPGEVIEGDYAFYTVASDKSPYYIPCRRNLSTGVVDEFDFNTWTWEAAE